MKELFHSFRIQVRVIGALLLREVITRYGRNNIGFMWLFAEPMLFTAGVAGLWSLIRAHTSQTIPVVAFAVTGYSSVLLWRNMPTRCGSAIEPNLALMYHRNVKVIDIFVSRVLLEAVGATISFILLSMLFSSLGLMNPPEDILEVIFGWLMLTWFGGAFALVIGGLAARSEIVEKLWHPASYITFPLSGAAFMVDWFPTSLQQYLLYVPMVNGTEILREGYFGGAVVAHYDVAYLVFFCLGTTLLGLALERSAAKYVTPL